MGLRLSIILALHELFIKWTSVIVIPADEGRGGWGLAMCLRFLLMLMCMLFVTECVSHFTTREFILRELKNSGYSHYGRYHLRTVSF